MRYIIITTPAVSCLIFFSGTTRSQGEGCELHIWTIFIFTRHTTTTYMACVTDNIVSNLYVTILDTSWRMTKANVLTFFFFRTDSFSLCYNRIFYLLNKCLPLSVPHKMFRCSKRKKNPVNPAKAFSAVRRDRVTVNELMVTLSLLETAKKKKKQ